MKKKASKSSVRKPKVCTMPAFGREVRRRRLELGMTLEDLGERSGLTSGYVGQVELGRRDPSLSTMAMLAAGLRTTLRDLFGGGPKLSPGALEIAKLLDGMDPLPRSGLLEIMNDSPKET